MGNVIAAIIEINDEVLPVTRGLMFGEFQEIRDLSKQQCKAAGDHNNADLLINAICNAYKFGFWLGWRHCEIEMPDAATAGDLDTAGILTRPGIMASRRGSADTAAAGESFDKAAAIGKEVDA